jgi:hypothetical protein
MVFLQEQLDFSVQLPIQKTIVCLWGLAGIGKSQLAAEFVNQQLASHPEREIFWINGESQESFEQSVIGMLKNKQNSSLLTSYHNVLPGVSGRERHALVNIFFAELDRLSDGRWLLVIDGVNESISSITEGSLPFDIHGKIRGLNRGFILLTSRRRDIVARYHPIWEVRGLKDEDAISLLSAQIHPDLMKGYISPYNIEQTKPLFRPRLIFHIQGLQIWYPY